MNYGSGVQGFGSDFSSYQFQTYDGLGQASSPCKEAGGGLAEGGAMDSVWEGKQFQERKFEDFSDAQLANMELEELVSHLGRV